MKKFVGRYIMHRAEKGFGKGLLDFTSAIYRYRFLSSAGVVSLSSDDQFVRQI